MDNLTTLLNGLKDKIPASLPAAGMLNQNVGSTERIASVIGGSLMTIYGITHAKSPIGAAIGLIGGALLFRGTTGFCPVNEALGIDTAEKTDTLPVIDKP